MKNYCLIILVIGLFFSNFIFAQDKADMDAIPFPQLPKENVLINGIIVDENKESLPYTTIRITIENFPFRVFRAVAAKEDGSFELSLPVNTKYVVTFQFMGYGQLTKTISTTTGTVNMGTIQMSPSDIQMKAIEIRPLVEISSREIVYNITSDPDRATSNMTDILRKMPMMEVGPDGNISIKGNKPNSTYIILRNGRKDALLNKDAVPYSEIMKRLPAMGFTKITLMLDPPALYKDYDYVISVESDKTVSLIGAIVKSNGNYDLERKIAGIDAGLIGSMDKIRFSTMVGYSKENSPKSYSDLYRESYTPDGDISETIRQSNQSYRKANAWQAGVNLSYDLGKRHFLNANFNYSNKDANHSDFANTTTTVSNQIASIRNRNSFISVKYHSYNGDINYQLDFEKPGRNFILSYRIADVSRNETMEIESTESDILIKTERKPGREKSTEHVFSISYLDKLGSKFDFDHKISYMHGDFLQQSNVFDQIPPAKEEENKELFTKLGRAIRRIDGLTDLSWKPGRNFSASVEVRWDYMFGSSETKSYRGTNPVEVIDQSGATFSPRLNIDILFPQKMPKASPPSAGKKTPPPPVMASLKRLSATYNMDQLRPGYFQLTNYINDADPNNITTGNPNLNNEIYHLFFLSFYNPVIYPAIGYAFSNNKIERVWYVNPTGQTVQSFRNSSRYQNLNLALIKHITLKAGSYISFYTRGVYSKNQIENHTRESYNLFANVDYSTLIFNRLFVLFASLGYSNYWNKGYSGFKEKMPVKLNINLRRIRTFSNSLKLEYGVRFANILDWKGKSETFVNSDLFSQKTISRQQRIPVMFQATVTFGSFKVKPVRKTKKTIEVGGFSDGKIPSVNKKE